MNYINQINCFWEKADESDKLKGNDIAVYFALLRINNKYGWKDSFRADWAEVSQNAHISKTTFYRSLDILQDAGFITYDKGVRNVLKPKISILKFGNRTGTEREQNEPRTGTEREQNVPLDKLLNNKTNKLINSKEEFDDFWDEYGKHGNRQSAEKAFSKLSKTEKELATDGAKNYVVWLKEKGDYKTSYHKHGATYLNGKSWNDELPTLKVKDETKEIDWKKFHSSPLY